MGNLLFVKSIFLPVFNFFLRVFSFIKGRVLREKQLDSSYFGEGIAIWNNLIYMLTWRFAFLFFWKFFRNGIGFVFDMKFDEIRTFKLPSEGWGLTHDKSHLIMSDGSDILYYLSPKTFQVRRRVSVYSVESEGAPRKPVRLLNELEMVDGFIYANIWGMTRIAVIDPSSGLVISWVCIFPFILNS